MKTSTTPRASVAHLGLARGGTRARDPTAWVAWARLRDPKQMKIVQTKKLERPLGSDDWRAFGQGEAGPRSVQAESPRPNNSARWTRQGKRNPEVDANAAPARRRASARFGPRPRGNGPGEHRAIHETHHHRRAPVAGLALIISLLVVSMAISIYRLQAMDEFTQTPRPEAGAGARSSSAAWQSSAPDAQRAHPRSRGADQERARGYVPHATPSWRNRCWRRSRSS